MHLMWWIAGILILLGLLIAVIGLLAAEDGYEDETGFHPSHSSEPRLTLNPACVLPGNTRQAT